MDRGVWWATVHGVARVGHDLVTKPPPDTTKIILHKLLFFMGFAKMLRTAELLSFGGPEIPVWNNEKHLVNIISSQINKDPWSFGSSSSQAPYLHRINSCSLRWPSLEGTFLTKTTLVTTCLFFSCKKLLIILPVRKSLTMWLFDITQKESIYVP